MGSKYDLLPFPRGRSFSDGNSAVIGTAENLQLLGKTYTVPDTVHGKGDVTLRVMMWTGSDTTVDRVCYAIATSTEGDYGRKVAAVTGSTGVVGLPLDDAMTLGDTMLQYDLFYFVQNGYCDVDTDDGSALAVGSIVTTAASGRLYTTAAAQDDQFTLGVLAEAATGVAGTAETVFVTCGDQLSVGT